MRYSISPFIQGILYESLNSNGDAIYHCQLRVDLHEAVKQTYLEEAIQFVVDRHEVLRSFFSFDNEQAHIIQKNLPIILKNEDFTTTKETLDDFAKIELNTPFDFQSPPLFRFCLIKLAENHYQFIWTFHHALLGGASILAIIEEIFQCYDAFAAKLTPELPTLYPYHHFLDHLSQQNLLLNNNYWQRLFIDFTFSSAIPGHLSNEQQKLATDSITFTIHQELTGHIKKLAKDHQLSLGTIINFTWGLLVAKSTYSDDIVFGTVRAFPEKLSQQHTGLLINTLPLRLRITPQQSTLQHLTDFYQQQHKLKDFLYQSLQDIKNSLQLAIDVSLFNTIVDYKPVAVEQIIKQRNSSWDNRKLAAMAIDHYPLSLEIYGHHDELKGRINFATNIYHCNFAKTLATQYITLLEEIIKHLNAPIQNLQSLKNQEKNIILQWSQGPKKEIIKKTVIRHFEEQALIHAEKTAIIFQKKSISFSALNQYAENIATVIEEKILSKPHKVIALYLEPSIEFIVALLAIAKTGASYLPLDPSYPEERLAFMLEDSHADCIITSSVFAIHKVFHTYNDIITLENIPSPSSKKKHAAIKQQDLNDPAYILYTSGSTGTPKGIVCTQLGLLNHMLWLIEQFAVQTKDKILHRTSLSFDASIWEIWLPLMTGATLCIADKDERQDSQALLQFIHTQQISIAQFFPSLLEIFLQQPLRKTCTSLKKVACGGGVLRKNLADSFYHKLPHAELYNFYGPTEASIDSTFFKVPSTQVSQHIPIGKAINNASIYILDKQMQLVPANTPGELYIGGYGLAQGYLQARQTQEKFISISSLSEKIVYKTGDLVQWSTEGNLEFIGRIDQQIKLNGYRIELDEIEHLLKNHPDIKHVVAIIDNQKIIVYYEARIALENTLLQNFLKKSLPRYMLPAIYIFIKKIPRLSSGKINRKLLPKPEAKTNFSPQYQTDYFLNEQQQIIKAIWSELLNTDQITSQDNFFELGGYSLLAMSLSIKLSTTFGIQVPIATIYEYPSIAEFSIWLNSQKARQDSALPNIIHHHSSDNQEFPLTDIQQAYWLGRNQTFELGGLSTHGYFEYQFDQLDIKKLEKAFNTLIQRHAALRLVFTHDGQQKILPKVDYYRFQYKNLSSYKQEDAETKFIKIRNTLSHQVLPADQWPLFEVRVTNYQNKFILHVSTDALIIDGWSLFLLHKEWSDLYHNEQANFPALEINFKDYVLTEQKIKNSPLYLRSKEYWQARLTKLPLGPELPLAHDHSIVTKPTFDRRSKTIPKEQWKILTKKIAARSLTPTIFLLNVFSEVLKRWSRSEHFCLNLTLFNRPALHPQINQILGDFTSLTLLEINHQHDTSFINKSLQLQKQLWQDLDHRFFSGIEVIRELSQQRHIESGSLFPVVFTSLLGFNSETQHNSLFTQPHYGITQTPQVRLDYKVYEVEGNLIIEWDYLQQAFPHKLIKLAHEEYCEILQQFIINDELWQQQQITQLPAEQQKHRTILSDLAPPHLPLLHELFLKQARQNPTKTAIVSAYGSFSYQEILEKANQLANYLITTNLKANQLVAVVMEKSWEQIVACLGILLAGGAYLPIDPSLPKEKLMQFLTLGQVYTTITQEKFTDKLLDHCFITLNDARLTTSAKTTPLINTTQDNLAYVIFTSGSTGLPKGVMIDHRGAMNTILDINQRFQVTAEDKILALSNLNFDLSVYDIFGILSVGGTIVMPTQEDVTNPSAWLTLLEKEQITLWNTVPMFMQMLIEQIEHTTDFTNYLRLALLSGDWIPLTLPEKAFKLLGKNLQLISLGGATEASIWSILYPINDIQPSWQSIPYGKAMQHQAVYVLNKQLEFCPDWVVGDIYIAGIGLAKGYWEDEIKTKAAFFLHPITQERLYRTGDIGCYLPDGNIKFLGREDYQVKIGGYRIELDEIEFAIRQQLPLEQVCVHTAEINGKKELIAYLVTDQGKDKLNSQLQQTGLRIVKNAPAVDLHYALENDVKKYYARKSYRQFSQEKLSRSTIDQWLQYKTKSQAITKFSLAKFLSKISAYQTVGQILPKYRYASAGSLYPVQCYLSIPEGFEVRSGHYYYQPCEQKLYFLNELTQPFTQLHFAFIANRNAIEPFYATNWRLFSEIEAGQMLALLTKNLYAQKQIADNLDSFFKLSDHHLVLGYWSLTQETNTLYQSQEEILFYFNDEKITTFEGGWYTYQNYQLSLKEKTSLHKEEIFSSWGEQAAIITESTGGIVWPKSFDGLTIGYMAQNLMQNGLDHNIGSCWLGNLSSDNNCHPVALIFGAIDPTQISSQETSQVKTKQDDLILWLQKKLSLSLPHYMIPKHYCLLAQLPLNNNGKIDRKALPIPSIEHKSSRADHANPRNAIEHQLCNIWQKTLAAPQINIYDDFFEFGGNSLLAIRMINRVNDYFNIDLSITSIFKLRTVAELAKLVQGDQGQTNTPIIIIQEKGEKTPLFLIHPADGFSFVYRSLAPYITDRIIYGINNPYFNSTDENFNSIEAMAACYIDLMMQAQPEGPYLIGGWSAGGVVAFEMAQQLLRQGKKASQVILLDSIVHSKFFHENNFSLEDFVADFSQNVLNDLPKNEANLFATEFRKNTELLMKYRPSNYEGQVTLLKAEENIFTQNPDEKIAMLCNGWDGCAKDLTIHSVTGNHYQLLGRASVAKVAQKIMMVCE